MKINIPTALMKYKKEITEFANTLGNSRNIETKLVGQTSKQNVYKELYIMNNPHMNPVNINLNCFEGEKSVYKMRPPEFTVEPGGVQAFVVFSSENIPLKVNSDVVAYEYKIKIEDNLKRLVQRYAIENEFQSASPKIITDVDLGMSNTVDLTKALSSLNEEKQQELKTVKYNDKMSQYIDIEFKKMNIGKNNIKIESRIKNTSDEFNISIKEIHVKFVNINEQKTLKVSNLIVVKSGTYKEITMTAPIKKFANIDFKTCKIKVVFK